MKKIAVLFCYGSGRLFRIESCHRREVSPATFSLNKQSSQQKLFRGGKGRNIAQVFFLRSFEISSSKFSKIRRQREEEGKNQGIPLRKMSTGKRSSSGKMAGSGRIRKAAGGTGVSLMVATMLMVVIVAEFAGRNGVNASRIIRHTNNKRSSSSSLNDYQDSSSLAKEQHHHQQQINGKYLSSNENQLGGGGGGGSGSDDDNLGPAAGAEPGATLFASGPSASSAASSSSLSSPLSHNSPQTLTLTADKNKTKLLKCHCDICKDQNYVCETDGLCFTSLSLEHGVYKYSYRCLHRRDYLGPFTWNWCRNQTDSEHSRNDHYCCYGPDLCNRSLQPQLPLEQGSS